jgi:cytoskeleton protein RodZ
VFEIGSSLRAAREHQGLELSAVERETRIRTKYLQALEDERFALLPGTAYVKGFLRTYADFLGLDGMRFVEEYNERFAPAEPLEAPPPVRVRRPRQIFGARLVAIPVAVAVGLFVWRLTSGGAHHHAAFVPTVPHVRVSTATPTPPAPRRPAAARIALVAARGPSWLLVRLGSESGRVLYEDMLEQGRTVRFTARRLWIRIGAPWNVDASLNGKRTQLPTTTGNVLVTPAALRSLGS